MPIGPCKKCGVEDRNASGKCRPCKAAYGKVWATLNKEKVKESQRRYSKSAKGKTSIKKAFRNWAVKNRRQLREYQRLRYSSVPEFRASCIKNATSYRVNNLNEVLAKQRKRHRVKRYGLTEEQFEAMKQMQGGLCALCSKPEPGPRNEWNIDHCHATGKVRALLCHFCNTGLGMFRDDPILLEKAVAYIRKHTDG